MVINHSTAILILPLIQVGQLSVIGELMCTKDWLTLDLSLPMKSVVRLTDPLTVTIVVDWDVKPQSKQTKRITMYLIFHLDIGMSFQATTGGGPMGGGSSLFAAAPKAGIGFGKAPTSSGFGKAPSTSSGFGKAPTSSGFGKAPSTSSGFGKASTSSGFGKAPSTSSGFGKAPSTSSGFGKAPSTSSGFGEAPSTSSGFGATTDAGASSLFGQPLTSAVFFGGAPSTQQQQQQLPFALPVSSDLFGTPTGAPAAFGQASTSIFGTPGTTQQQSLLFGAPSSSMQQQQSGFGFGTSGMSGAGFSFHASTGSSTCFGSKAPSGPHGLPGPEGSSGFSFGAPSSTMQQQQSGFGFGSTAGTGFSIGATTAAPSQVGQATMSFFGTSRPQGNSSLFCSTSGAEIQTGEAFQAPSYPFHGGPPLPPPSFAPSADTTAGFQFGASTTTSALQQEPRIQSAGGFMFGKGPADLSEVEEFPLMPCLAPPEVHLDEALIAKYEQELREADSIALPDDDEDLDFGFEKAEAKHDELKDLDMATAFFDPKSRAMAVSTTYEASPEKTEATNSPRVPPASRGKQIATKAARKGAPATGGVKTPSESEEDGEEEEEEEVIPMTKYAGKAFRKSAPLTNIVRVASEEKEESESSSTSSDSDESSSEDRGSSVVHRKVFGDTSLATGKAKPMAKVSKGVRAPPKGIASKFALSSGPKAKPIKALSSSASSSSSSSSSSSEEDKTQVEKKDKKATPQLAHWAACKSAPVAEHILLIPSGSEDDEDDREIETTKVSSPWEMKQLETTGALKTSWKATGGEVKKLGAWEVKRQSGAPARGGGTRGRGGRGMGYVSSRSRRSGPSDMVFGSGGFRFSATEDKSEKSASKQAAPVSPSYSPTSPSYLHIGPSYSPTAPSYIPTGLSYSPTAPSSPVACSYSPTPLSYSATALEDVGPGQAVPSQTFASRDIPEQAGTSWLDSSGSLARRSRWDSIPAPAPVTISADALTREAKERWSKETDTRRPSGQEFTAEKYAAPSELQYEYRSNANLVLQADSSLGMYHFFSFSS